MAKRECRSEYKRRVRMDEIARRVGLMRPSEIATEFAAIENGYEVRIRFVPEPFVPVAQQPVDEARSRQKRIAKRV